MFSIRERTLSPSSSFLIRSLGVRGSRWPRAHWPCPLCALLRSVVLVRGGADVLVAAGGAMVAVSVVGGAGRRRARTGAQAGAAPDVRGRRGSAAHTDRARHVTEVHVEPRHEQKLA